MNMFGFFSGCVVFFRNEFDTGISLAPIHLNDINSKLSISQGSVKMFIECMAEIMAICWVPKTKLSLGI